MSNVRLIAELGSTHMGKLDRIKEAIDRCKASGIDALKLQLFPNEAPYVPTNIFLPQEMFREAFEYGNQVGLPVSASVFDNKSFYFLTDLEPEFVKFSFSKKNDTYKIDLVLQKGIEAIVSCDVMSDGALPEGSTKLYCIPEYPVRYEVAFDELFGSTWSWPDGATHETQGRFDGFSDHTLGVRQTRRAIEAGAQIIEKHVRLGYDDETCPDARFAVTIEEFAGVRK